MAAIGSLKTALANAEAVPVEARPYHVVKGSADVPRRVLGAADIAAVVRAELGERRRALADYERLGVAADDLRTEIATLERYRRPD